VAIPVLQIPMIVMSGGVPGNPFDAGFFAGFAVSGSFFLVAFHNNPIVRRSPRLDDHPLFRTRLF
jgi:hypothetical protein